MFLIAGVSPKIRVLDDAPRICPSCGLAQARLKRADSYFNLFFIPVFRVKKGEPFVSCDRCESTSDLFSSHDASVPIRRGTCCNHCGKALNKKFQYCPYCGKPV
ncbi:MAG: zinc ribbon domain-containing protein [Deltaproteobacteria bacterium]|nr:zinc ribbon domain-containing protein [Deltaproteobacteria bacterium]